MHSSATQYFKQVFRLTTCLSICMLCFGLVLSQQAIADTNVSGVEIEIISETVDSDLVGDPVQDFLSDIDTNEADQSYQQDTIVDIDSDIDLWSRIKTGYAIPNLKSQYTTNHETWYASRPDYMRRMLERSQKYLFHIVEEVEKRGMPTEIALLPMIESAFNPQAYSRSAASGIWQFIPSTGKSFGLQQNWWVDNRRDVTAATNAALTYLQKLHGMFGTWDLALAAYNAGEGTVQRAINKNRSKGLPTDYESLSLPPETRNYVPKLQAIKNIVTDPERFGLKINSIPNRPYFARVTTPKQIDAKLAAELAEISFEEFSSLNPSYNRPVITATNDKHQLLLPVWAAERFVTNLANYDKPLTNWQTYNAKRGERMDNIAKKFGINVAQLRSVNGLTSAKKMRVAQPMLVPAIHDDNLDNDINNEESIDVAELEKNNLHESEPKLSSSLIYTVKRGDTLHAIADKYDTDSKILMKINRLKSSKLKVGQTIKLSTTTVAVNKSSRSSTKKVSVKQRVKSKKTKSRNIKARSIVRIR
ncbi:MAG: transglycosylase SLT domain-containing protein [Methylotenera sp.]|nr:transglycosylase SLT domain-containing protein [Methylotenera sp.]